MSLATRLTAFAQAVGADIKSLNGKITYKGDWNAVTVYKKGDQVWYSNDLWLAVTNVSGAGDFPSSDSPSAWRLVTEGMPIGGDPGQILAKYGANAFETEWIDAPSGGSALAAAAYNQGSYSASITPGAAAWQKFLVGSGSGEVIDPVGKYVRNADGSISVVDAGWYSIQASVQANAVSCSCQISIGDTPNVLGTYALDGDSSSAASFARASTSCTVKLAAGAKIYANGWVSAAAISLTLVAFSIARVGGPKGDKGDTGGNATVPIDPWHLVGAVGEPAFTGGWTNYSGAPPLRFRKDPLGRVWVTGAIVPGAGTAFTLPAGYRPVRNEVVDSLQTNGYAGTYVSVGLSGAVTPAVGAGYIGYLDFSFDTETVTAMPSGPKGDKGDVGGTMGSANLQQTAKGANVTLNGWAAIPLGPALIEPADAFVVSGNSVTVKEAGWYHVAATLFSPLGSANTVFIALATSAVPGDGDIANGSSKPDAYSRAGAAGSVKLAAGAKVYLHGWSNSNTAFFCQNFSIEKIGGPKGDKGDIGNSGSSMTAIANPASGSIVNSAAGGWLQFPFPVAADLVISSSDGSPDFTRNASGSLTFNKAGTYQISASMGNQTAPQPTAVTMDLRLMVGPVGVVTPDNNATALAIERFITGANEYNIASLAATVTVVAGQSLSAWGFVGGAVNGLGISKFAVVRAGGPQGVKGDTGGNAVVPMDSWHTVGTVGEPAFINGWTAQPGYTVKFRKDPWGNVHLQGVLKPGTSAAAFVLPVGYRPAGNERGFVCQTNNSTTLIWVAADGTVYVNGYSTLTYVYTDPVEFDTDTVSQYLVGPQGPKGDPGGVNVLTTLDWDTAITSNFYRSYQTVDFMDFQKTVHGPGDTLNPPPQAGIVAAHANGYVVQRVWDLNTHIAWTRHKLYDGSWTPWAADLSKPEVWADLMVGGATPAEGDERYFQTAAMLAQGCMWKFRYHKVSAKWHFVGGSDYLFTAAAISAAANASATDAALSFPAILPGSYDVEWGARMYQNPSGPASGNVQLLVDQMRGASTISSVGMDIWTGQIAGQSWSTVIPGYKSTRITGVVNGDAIRLRSSSSNYNGALESPYMRIRPVSVSM